MQNTLDTAPPSDFDVLVLKFIDHAQDVIRSKATLAADPGGRRYIRIVENYNDSDQRSVYAFIDRTNGDLLKPETWKAPAKHARGNLYDRSTWTCAGPYGMAYLKH